MKDALPEMVDDIGSPLTTFTRCVKITRTDGVVLAFTELDQPFTFNDVLHKPGYDPTAVVSTDQMNVDNLEWHGVVDHEDITSADIRAGIYDDAKFEKYRVNWNDLTHGRVILKTGTIGNVHLNYPNEFIAEGRSLDQALQVKIGMHFTPGCKWDLGDARCKFNLTAPVIANIPFWEPNHVYALGDRVRPRRTTGFFYVVNQAGTSGATEPNWEAGTP